MSPGKNDSAMPAESVATCSSKCESGPALCHGQKLLDVRSAHGIRGRMKAPHACQAAAIGNAGAKK